MYSFYLTLIVLGGGGGLGVKFTIIFFLHNKNTKLLVGGKKIWGPKFFCRVLFFYKCRSYLKLKKFLNIFAPTLSYIYIYLLEFFYPNEFFWFPWISVWYPQNNFFYPKIKLCLCCRFMSVVEVAPCKKRSILSHLFSNFFMY